MKICTRYVTLFLCLFVLLCLTINDTFNNISVISWWSVLLVEETTVPGEKPLTSCKSHNVVHFPPDWDWNSQHQWYFFLCFENIDFLLPLSLDMMGIKFYSCLYFRLAFCELNLLKYYWPSSINAVNSSDSLQPYGFKPIHSC